VKAKWVKLRRWTDEDGEEDGAEEGTDKTLDSLLGGELDERGSAEEHS
jgi:hypothetical protein